ncbi:MAG: hypothetical protein KAS30_02785 [Candidatus Diapherotrites archaeon]|nr:hypothetical protein [Candidatus Diapherotrites archaeon]
MNSLIMPFGSFFGKKDRLAIDVCTELAKNTVLQKKFEFDFSSSPDILIDLSQNREIIVVDVVKNLKEVQEIFDINQLENKGSISSHDFDLAFYLMLLQKLGNAENISIIGIPYGLNIKKATLKVEKVLENY